MHMRLMILGMNGPFPASGSACSGYLVQGERAEIAVDLGCGTLATLTSLTPPEGLTALLLTHWHGDHCSDVLPMLYRLESVAARLGVAWKPLDIYAPLDESSPVRVAVKKCGAVRLHDTAPGETLMLAGMEVQTFAARHPVPALMYRLTEQGKALAMTGDTNDTPDLPALAKSADLLVADGLFPQAAWGESKPHLSARMAAELARDAGARALLITHLNPDFEPSTLLREAREVYPTAELARCGMQLGL